MEHNYKDISVAMERLGQMSPGQMGAWDRFMTTTEDKGALSQRQKAVVSVALSVCAKCEMSIMYHVKRALELGASNQEIMEAAWVAVIMGGGPALMYSQLVLKALEELQDVGEDEMIQRSQAQLAIDNDYKKLYWLLLDYVKAICNEAEAKCNGDESRVKLAMNIAENDSSILGRLALNESEKRGWD